MTVHDEMLLFALKNLFEMDSMQCIRGREFKCILFRHAFHNIVGLLCTELGIRPNMWPNPMDGATSAISRLGRVFAMGILWYFIFFLWSSCIASHFIWIQGKIKTFWIHLPKEIRHPSIFDDQFSHKFAQFSIRYSLKWSKRRFLRRKFDYELKATFDPLSANSKGYYSLRSWVRAVTCTKSPQMDQKRPLS